MTKMTKHFNSIYLFVSFRLTANHFLAQKVPKWEQTSNLVILIILNVKCGAPYNYLPAFPYTFSGPSLLLHFLHPLFLLSISKRPLYRLSCPSTSGNEGKRSVKHKIHKPSLRNVVDTNMPVFFFTQIHTHNPRDETVYFDMAWNYTRI